MTDQQVKSRFGLGVDLGGTTIQIGAVDSAGQILESEHIATKSYEGPEAVLRRIGETSRLVCKRVGSAPCALGMGVPGLVDLEHGITRFCPNLEGKWRDINVREILEPLVECKVYLLNDVRTATLGELTFGHGKGSDETMIFFALGTGIGGGVAIDGHLRLGPLGAAGELGHLTVEPSGRMCGCGNKGCVEAYASGPALTSEGVRLMLSGQASTLYDIVEGNVSKINPKTMSEAAKAGDKAIAQAIVEAAEYLAIAVANMVVTLHPGLIVIGGGVAGIGDLLFDTVREGLARRVHMMPTDDIRILPSAVGNKAGLLGAGALALNEGKV